MTKTTTKTIAIVGAVTTTAVIGSVLYTKASIVALAWLGLISVSVAAGTVEGMVVYARLEKHRLDTEKAGQ
jgi:predicted solute-binding protein